MTQKQQIERLEDRVRVLEALVLELQARPVYPYYIPPYVPPSSPWVSPFTYGTGDVTPCSYPTTVSGGELTGGSI